MKKKLMLSNAAIIVVGFIAAFLLAALQVQRQYQTEFTRRLDTALSILSTQTEDIQREPETAATNVGVELEKAGQEMRISVIDLNGKVSATARRKISTKTTAAGPKSYRPGKTAAAMTHASAQA